MTIRKKNLAVILAMLCSNVVFAQSGVPSLDVNSDMRILESTETGLTLEYRPRFLSVQKVSADGMECQVVRFDRNSTWDSRDAGKPDVRFRSVAIGLPGRRNNSVTVIAADYETSGGITIAPVPSIVPRSPQHPDGRLYKSLRSSEFAEYPASIAALSNVAAVKGVPVGYLKLFPVQYNGTAKSVRKYSRIVVRVDFGPREATAGAVDDGWMRSALLNYSVAKNWLRSVSGLSKRTPVNSALSSGTWFKLEVRDDGMYKIDATFLRSLGLDPSSISSIKDLKVFGNNARALPADLLAARAPDLAQQSVLYVDNNSNGKFDADDYILFYGQGVTGWTYSPVQEEFSHYTNPYTNSNFYFLQYAPQTGAAKEMAVTTAPSSGAVVGTTLGKFFFHEERTNVTESGLEWYSAPMNPNDTRVIANKLSGYLPGTAVHYKYEMLARADVGSEFDIDESGTHISALYVDGFPLDVLNGDPVGDFANRSLGQTSTVPSLTDNRSTVKISYVANSSIARGYINWLELTYTQQLSGADGPLLFTSPDTSGAVEFSLSGFSGTGFSVFDITDAADVRRVPSSPDQVVGTYYFRDNLTAGTVRRYWAGMPSGFKTPVSFSRVPNSNLRGMNPGADFVIITHRDFVGEAQRLKSFKENLPGGDALKTAVVEVDTIYSEFGGGMPDPVAIRDFLEYATANWQPAPRYVLFFGDACFDYKNILGIDRNWVPTFETPETDSQIDTYGYDDFFATLQPGNIFTVTIADGRLPVRSVAEARLSVDRIIKYESAPTFGTWKNLITIVADDRNVNGELDPADNPEQAERLAVGFVPSFYEVKKIYEEDYPTVIASSGRTKPEARQALIDQVNRGTLVMNFTGHGNPKVWAHETILTKDDVITQFVNGDRLALIVAATCDWGRFDAAADQSSAEMAMVNPNGGTIGVISADRPVWSNDNELLNDQLYAFLFPKNTYSRTLRMGDGQMLAKNDPSSGSPDNNRKYHLLADPTLRLAVPRLVMQIDSINGVPVSAASFDTLHALSKVTIKASIRDSSSTVTPINSDSALVTVFDAARTENVYDSDVGHSFSFVKPGAIIYKGENTIRNGRLSATFIIPKDISYENKQGRISSYFSGNGVDGRGFTDRVIVGGTVTSLANDTQGPTIKIYLDGRTFRSGDLVSENPKLIVDLADSSGINSAGSSIGHGLEAWIDGSAKSTDLTEYYKGAQDNYQAGSVEYQLSGLGGGRHTLRVRAWDVYNNSSSAQVDFVVASGTALALENVYNIPNPVRSTTTFTFQHNQLTAVDVEIKIYTVSGRLIQALSTYGYPNRFVEIPWDCRDRDGAKIGNGTYLYKVMAKTVDGRFASEALGKMSIVR